MAPSDTMPGSGPNPAGGSPSASDVWRALLALTAPGARSGLARAPALGRGPGGGTIVLAEDAPAVCLLRRPDDGWRPAPALDAGARSLAELYLPLVAASPERCYVVGHLGQSLDGFIATADGDSDFVTGPENLDHLHRMRALCKAIVVGAGTIAADDPELTTRRVEGPSPTRVILDRRRRLEPHHRVFNDAKAETWLVCDEALSARPAPAGVRVVGVPVSDGRLDLEVLLAELHAQERNTVFVEGGGVAVSGFLGAGLLDRLHVAIAPLVIGRGRPGLDVPGQTSLAACARPSCRVFAMGRDILFDCDLRTHDIDAPAPTLLQIG